MWPFYPLNAELPLGVRATLCENDRGVVLDGAAYGVAHARFGGDLSTTLTRQRHTCAPTAIWQGVQRDLDALRGAPELVTVTPPRLRWSVTLSSGTQR